MKQAFSIDEFEDNYDGNLSEHIAIIGMTGRFPGAQNVKELWQNLHAGVESISFFTSQELAASNLDPSLLNNAQYVGADGVIDNMDMFDAEFFNYTPREAELMDPQHRLFLECAWEAMECAGYDSESYDGRVGVYASANLSSYLIRNIMSNPRLRATATSFHTMLGNDKDFIATRVSFKLNLTGPSINVATLCSSSFVGINLACQSLLNYQCDLALAGAISLQASRNEAFFYQEGGIGAPDGHCRAFDAKASGTVSGSGVGIVVLKRLEDALTDGDCIRAIIRGSAVNNDGSLKLSYTAPSVDGQSEVIAEALALAGVAPETITYVETHGTGTRLGDPIEIEALTRAFRAGTQKTGFCAVGSIKTNIGHLVNAGGVASLMKTVLALEHKQIPASLNFEEPNPQIDFASSPFYVNTELSEWKTNGAPRRAGVSSFGIGGTNVHMIVEEAPEVGPSGESRPWQLLVLSATTQSALEKQTTNLIECLKESSDINLADAAYTLHVGRRAFNYRRMLLCRDVPEALEALNTMDPQRVHTQFQESRDRPVAFLFPATAVLHTNMGRDLYEHELTFREQVDLGAEIIKPMLQVDLRHVLYPQEAQSGYAEQQLERPGVAQAALFVLEYALAILWMEWGIRPQTMLGQGVGEYVAACLAGVLSLADALTLAVARGQADADDALAQTFANQVMQLELSSPQIPYLSGVSGAPMTAEQAMDANYWRRQLSEVADADAGLKQLLKEPEQILLEVGPTQHWSLSIEQHPAKAAHQTILPSVGQQLDMVGVLLTLGNLWLAGAQVDWNGFHTHEFRHRLPLPTYPFERKRYWVDAQSEGYAAGVTEQQLLTTKKPEMADWFYIPSWKRSLWPAPQTKETAVPPSWLLFVDDYGLGDRLAEWLEQEGVNVIIVKTGSTYTHLSDNVFTVNPRHQADYEALLQELNRYEMHLQKVVHLWSLTTNDIEAISERMNEAQSRGFYSLLFFAQALGRLGFTEELQINIVSNNLHEVTIADDLCPEKATLLSPVKVIPQEYPNITCRSIDLVWPIPDSLQERFLLDHLEAELDSDNTELIVAYRGRHRWVQTFEPVFLAESAKASSYLQKDGVYLIVGGLTGIGFVLAERLARTINARLALTVDAELPARDAWESWLNTHDETDMVSRQIQRLQEFAALGTPVITLTADMSQRQQIETAVARTEEYFGQLNGVVYAASDFGRTALEFIEETDQVKCEQQFQTTMCEILALAEALADKQLDFCLLASSLSSVLGGLGLVAYAARYNFLDAFAHQCNQKHAFPWITVNWDSWQFDQGVGSPLSASLESLALMPEEGADTFERALACNSIGQLVISAVDLHARIDHWVTPGSIPHHTKSNQEQPITYHERPNLPTPYVAPRNEPEQMLADIWQRSVGIESIGIHDNFFELGGDSLLAVQIISQAREIFNVDLPLSNLFERPTVAFLAEYIEAVRWAAQDHEASSTSHEDDREEIEL